MSGRRDQRRGAYTFEATVDLGTGEDIEVEVEVDLTPPSDLRPATLNDPGAPGDAGECEIVAVRDAAGMDLLPAIRAQDAAEYRKSAAACVRGLVWQSTEDRLAELAIERATDE